MSTLLLDKTKQLPPPTRTAFLLDFDGTLVDIAATAEAVVIPEELPNLLLGLRKKCNDAVAIVSGRPIEQIDSLLGKVPYAIAGEHGLTLRFRPNIPIQRIKTAPLPEKWLIRAEQIKKEYPAIRVEKKHNSLVLHFRAVPELGELLREEMDSWLQNQQDSFMLQSSKMAWEMKPIGINKGEALKMIMSYPPFQGRIPVFVGDDVTDEDGIKAVTRMKGVGFRIPRDFPNPKILRAWLRTLVESKGDSWLAE